MGCGTICGNNSSTAETFKQAQDSLSKLMTVVVPNKFLLSITVFHNFAKQVQLNPFRYQLLLTDKLHAKAIVTIQVMEKWKIILFGLDLDSSAYVNCLGISQNAMPKEIAHDNNLALREDGLEDPGMPDPQPIFHHKCFVQIQKDLDRTFELPTFQRTIFQNILKRIANHFPSMGYTQGINFIVGYLLIIGFSQNDTFWIFTHIALNRRYMLLGLFQDGFPLSNMYVLLFKNILRRKNPQLYEHLFEKVALNESIWVFKWFMTYYIYSFPQEMCQYIFDTVISIGGIGLVTFAVSLVFSLEKQLLEYDDPCDISQFLQGLKQIQTFNQYINLREVVKRAYLIKVESQDLQGLSLLTNTKGQKNIYAQYYLLSFKQNLQSQSNNKENENTQLKQPKLSPKVRLHEILNSTNSIHFHHNSNIEQKSEQILNTWYESLRKERTQFVKKSSKGQQNSAKSISSKRKKKKSMKEDDNHLNLILNINNQNKESIQKIIIKNDVKYEKKSNDNDEVCSQHSSNKQRKNSQEQIHSSQLYLKAKKEKVNLDDFWDEDQEKYKEQKNDKIEDSFLYLPENINLKKKKTSRNSEPIDILSQYSSQSKNQTVKNSHKSKNIINKEDSQSSSYQGSILNGGNSFMRVGQQIITNISSGNASGRSSISSKHTEEKKKSFRYCNCVTKNYTEEHKKNSFCHPQQKKIDYHRKRFNTVFNSQSPKIQKSQNQLPGRVDLRREEVVSQIDVSNEGELFKKKNKVNRFGKATKNIQQNSELQLKRNTNRENDIEESIDAIVMNKFSTSNLQIEIQSVK